MIATDLGLFDHPDNSFIYARIFYDEKGQPVDFVYLDVNHAFEKFVGLKKESIIGKKSTEIGTVNRQR